MSQNVRFVPERHLWVRKWRQRTKGFIASHNAGTHTTLADIPGSICCLGRDEIYKLWNILGLKRTGMSCRKWGGRGQERVAPFWAGPTVILNFWRAHYWARTSGWKKNAEISLLGKTRLANSKRWYQKQEAWVYPGVFWTSNSMCLMGLSETATPWGHIACFGCWGRAIERVEGYQYTRFWYTEQFSFLRFW